MRGEHDAHAAGIADHGGADLEQSEADRAGGGLGQFRAGQRDGAQALHQGVGERGEHQAQPVGVELVATGAGAEEIELRFLDAILRLAALAVEFVVESIRR